MFLLNSVLQYSQIVLVQFMQNYMNDKMCDNENQTLLNNFELKLYPKRWWIALTLATQCPIVRYFYADYFNISYIAVDWFTIIQYPGKFFNSLVYLLKQRGIKKIINRYWFKLYFYKLFYAVS